MTTFDIYVKGIEERRARERNFAVNAELTRRLRDRTETETLAALLSLTLFPAETKAEARDPSGAAYEKKKKKEKYFPKNA